MQNVRKFEANFNHVTERSQGYFPLKIFGRNKSIFVTINSTDECYVTNRVTQFSHMKNQRTLCVTTESCNFKFLSNQRNTSLLPYISL